MERALRCSPERSCYLSRSVLSGIGGGHRRGRESAPGGAQSPCQLSKEGSSGQTRNPVGVGARVVELAQHNLPPAPTPRSPGSALPSLALGTVLGARPTAVLPRGYSSSSQGLTQAPLAPSWHLPSSKRFQGVPVSPVLDQHPLVLAGLLPSLLCPGRWGLAQGPQGWPQSSVRLHPSPWGSPTLDPQPLAGSPAWVCWEIPRFPQRMSPAGPRCW